MTPELKPLLVSVRHAREILSIGNNKFWQLAKQGELELVGGERKRLVVFASIEKYVDRLPRRATTVRDHGSATVTSVAE